MSRTIAIVGAGPIGGILAAYLVSAGHEVAVVDSWKEHLERVRAEGLCITTGREEVRARPARVHASIRELELDERMPEFVFVCTKASSIGEVLDGIGPRVRASGAVFVSFQNGIDTEAGMAERLGKGRVLRGVVHYAGVLTAPGEIRESFLNPPNYLGWLDPGAEASCRDAAGVLTAAGLQTEATGEIQHRAWRKTVFNTCIMAVSAVTGLNMQEIMRFPPTERLADGLLEESIAVAAARGFDFGPGFAEQVREFHRHIGPHRPSMLADIEHGRRTENAFLVRRIAEYADLEGVPAPLHHTLAAVIEGLELRGRRPQPEF
ncbi:MAG: 2-dehydropantoate 2-reductase [Acidobacteriota bacterium]|jgi:2-dehydropantoate 2-reductase|nr:2-dehydropantoate 2-reductase [Acidobacteriota bacterium]NLT32083.1 2-dehydropantoate 2-reductase [Acidobacteriota bacterium]